MSGKNSHKGVFETWVVALERYGRGPNPVPKIHSFMKSEFPGRKTDWKSWANLVRQRYNRGAFLKGHKPRRPIPLFTA